MPAKALIEVGGCAMGARVVETLGRHASIDRVRVFGNLNALTTLGGVVVEPSAPTIAATVRPLVENLREPVLITTADHPLLDAEIIDAFVAGAEGHDIAVGVVERKVFEAHYPRNRRTWLRFRGGAYSGANLFWIGSARAMPVLDVWQGVEQQRKRGRALIAAFGLVLLLGTGLRLLTLQGALMRIGKRFGVSVAAVELPQPEACIDVDAPADRDLVETILAGRP